jgi:hypothetical protein
MHGDRWQAGFRLAASVAALGMVLAACGSAATTSPSSPSKQTSQAHKSSKKSSKASSTSRSSASSKASSGALSVCSTDALAASLAEPSGAAGTTYYQLRLKNVSTHSCTVYGYPGVSLVKSATGPQIGRSATRQPGTETTLTLQPGQFAEATLGIEVAQNYSASTCQPTKAGGVLVYPPNQRAALFIAASGLYGCASRSIKLLTIGPLRPAPQS